MGRPWVGLKSLLQVGVPDPTGHLGWMRFLPALRMAVWAVWFAAGPLIVLMRPEPTPLSLGEACMHAAFNLTLFLAMALQWWALRAQARHVRWAFWIEAMLLVVSCIWLVRSLARLDIDPGLYVSLAARAVFLWRLRLAAKVQADSS